jgi:hypothetical protein
MTLKNTDDITVEPDEEEDSARLFQSFGWKLKSVQEVKTPDARIFAEQDDGGTEQYIKLTFERNPGRQDHAESKTL